MEAIALDGAVGWFHPATGGRGVVVVGAHGYEDLCSRVTLRSLADGLASAGLPTLRIDPRDTGDAADLAADADRVAAWTADTIAALRWMRETVGVSEIVLVGLRVGALVATAAALDFGEVDRLVLLAPPANGRALRRELSILARLVEGTGGAAHGDGAVEIAGFRLEAATLERLAAIDLTALPRAPAHDVLLVGDVGSAAFGRLVGALETTGAAVSTQPFEGYARMMCDPTASEPALEMAAALIARLARDLPAATVAPVKLAAARLVGDGWIEERLVFGDGLAGVLCLPTMPQTPRRSAIWLNSGRNHHIGWARQTVDLSRRLARSGVAVLRMDLAGIGDSPAHAHTPPTALYHDVGRADVVAAIEEMARHGLVRPWVIGACSGAYQAFHTAVDDPRIAGIVLINQLCFVWDASYAVHLSAWMKARPHEFEADAKRAEASDGDLGHEGPLDIAWRLAKRGVRIGLDTYRRLRAGGANGRPGPIESRFRALSARGVAVSIVLSEGDKAVGELELHTGSGGERIADLPGVEILVIPDSDHSLTPTAARERLGNHLVARLAETGGGHDRRVPHPADDGRETGGHTVTPSSFATAARAALMRGIAT
jgi:alpha-beta hydrolase superfamily lysophospholipase